MLLSICTDSYHFLPPVGQNQRPQKLNSRNLDHFNLDGRVKPSLENTLFNCKFLDPSPSVLTSYVAPSLALLQAAVARVGGGRLDGGGAALTQELEMGDYEMEQPKLGT